MDECEEENDDRLLYEVRTIVYGKIPEQESGEYRPDEHTDEGCYCDLKYY
jgi:hypothetical protein